MDLELHILCKVSTMIIMTELNSSTFFHAQSRIKTPKIWCLASGPQEWSMVHEGSPWTRSTKVVHGPGVSVLSFPLVDKQNVSDDKFVNNHL